MTVLPAAAVLALVRLMPGELAAGRAARFCLLRLLFLTIHFWRWRLRLRDARYRLEKP